MTTRNVYRLQSRNGNYYPVSRETANALIEKGGAEWVGTDYDEDKDEYVHYADRID